LTFFEEQLEQGIFQICYCEKCNHAIWPPKEICHLCHEETKWKESMNRGTIIEFSKKDSVYFGLIEIDDEIKILGEILSSTEPEIGQRVKMAASFQNKPKYSFTVENN
jgi:uncharacterized OB-fold protein